ncbi:rho/rac/cdc gtpase-activating protein [Anaeramoeba flamelloides]|uniref:Rho/rac/cdc gtpase-activating protein n=1 Tax=Anaeramoeba flamelloides TaxID=1746091 RepID=A0AAV7ZB14_9EUKA|nr:rho/rac/cdc gtpase-activating protein [Anaeramoeba flamelloides]KAJ6253008.1 rho/rac/cdc gtpase-activating protein [Anaeramoeba flamelloides]
MSKQLEISNPQIIYTKQNSNSTSKYPLIIEDPIHYQKDSLEAQPELFEDPQTLLLKQLLEQAENLNFQTSNSETKRNSRELSNEGDFNQQTNNEKKKQEKKKKPKNKKNLFGKKIKKKKIVRKKLNETQIFGVPLEKVLQRDSRSNYSAPKLIEECILFLEWKGIESEGLYRITGSIEKRDELKKQYNLGIDVSFESINSLDTVASLIKQFLRDLPDHVFGPKNSQIIDKLSQLDNNDEQLKYFSEFLPQIPLPNFSLLYLLMPHLKRVSKKSEINKMTAWNLSIVFSPTLRIPGDIVAFMIKNWDEIIFGIKNF